MLLFAFRQIEDLRYDLPELFRITFNGLLIARGAKRLVKKLADCDGACHELMAQTVEWLAKLVYKLHGGSYQLMSNHLHNMTSDHRVAGSSPAGCKASPIANPRAI